LDIPANTGKPRKTARSGSCGNAPFYRSVCQNTAGTGLKNESCQGHLNRRLFLPVFYLFGGRFAVKRVVIELVFSGDI
jgi:hypothetical protein